MQELPDLKLIRQHPESDDCLPCCAQMVLSYYNDSKTSNYIAKKLHIYKKHSGLRGAYLQDLGRYALKREYKSIIFHYDWHWWNQQVFDAIGKNQKLLITSLENLKKEKNDWADKKNINKDIAYINTGGNYEMKIPKLQTLDYYLQIKIPPIILVQAEYFYHNPKTNYTHSIVVVGKKDKKYLIRDPLYAIEEVPDDELLYSWSRTGGWMIVLLPKPEKSKMQQTELKF